MDELAGELPFVQEDIDRFRQYCLQNAYRRERLKKGDVLQMPDASSCCFLHKGRLKVFIGTDSGSERLMWFLESGNIIPEGSGETFSKRLVADCDRKGRLRLCAHRRRRSRCAPAPLQKTLYPAFAVHSPRARRKQPQPRLPFPLPDRHQLWQRRPRRSPGRKTAQPQRYRRSLRHSPQQCHPLFERSGKARRGHQAEKIPGHPRYPSPQRTAHPR